MPQKFIKCKLKQDTHGTNCEGYVVPCCMIKRDAFQTNKSITR